MGIFSNSSDLFAYYDSYCTNCVHNQGESGCPCLDMHEIFGEGEMKNEGSLLHEIIPVENGKNKKCIFWAPASDEGPMADIRKHLGLDHWRNT